MKVHGKPIISAAMGAARTQKHEHHNRCESLEYFLVWMRFLRNLRLAFQPRCAPCPLFTPADIFPRPLSSYDLFFAACHFSHFNSRLRPGARPPPTFTVISSPGTEPASWPFPPIPVRQPLPLISRIVSPTRRPRRSLRPLALSHGPPPIMGASKFPRGPRNPHRQSCFFISTSLKPTPRKKSFHGISSGSPQTYFAKKKPIPDLHGLPLQAAFGVLRRKSAKENAPSWP